MKRGDENEGGTNMKVGHGSSCDHLNGLSQLHDSAKEWVKSSNFYPCWMLEEGEQTRDRTAFFSIEVTFFLLLIPSEVLCKVWAGLRAQLQRTKTFTAHDQKRHNLLILPLPQADTNIEAIS